jgi:hypothetical protein
MSNNNCKTGKCNKGSCKNTTPVVVDAESVPVAAATATTEVISDPAKLIKDRSANFHELYERYAVLRELASRLNGLSQAALFPENVKIPKITIEFTADDKPYSVAIDNLKLIGEVAPLISAGLRYAVETMYDDLFAVEHVASEMQKAVAAALSQPVANEQTNTTNTDEEKT